MSSDHERPASALGRASLEQPSVSEGMAGSSDLPGGEQRDSPAGEVLSRPSSELAGEQSSHSVYELPRASRTSTTEDGPPHEPAPTDQPPRPGRASTAPELDRSGSWVKRVQHRTEQLRKLFQLPPSESLMDEYYAALRKKVLLQGRLFVFDEHLAFYCNLFGYKKQYCIALKDVTSVQRKKNVGFPNSIEVRTSGGRKYFFTSLLSREDAYRLIISLWRQCSEHAKEHPESDWEVEASGSRGAAGTRPRRDSSRMYKILRGVTKMVGRESVYGLAQEPGMLPAVSPSASVAEGMAGETEAEGDGEGPNAASRSLMAATGSEVLSGAGVEPAGGEMPGGGIEELGAESSAPALAQPGGPQGEDHQEFRELTTEQCEQGIRTAFDSATEEAPPVDPSYKPLLDFPLPCTPCEFWCRVLSIHSDFYQRFHQAQQHSSIQLGRWQQHYAVGMVRDLQFVSPLKWKMGPPQTLCNQMQRCKVYRGRHLVFETSQTQMDIPYGDHFKVETRWDVVPSGAGACRVSVAMRVPFSKATVWKKFIEKGSYDNCMEAAQLFRRMVEASLENDRAASQQAAQEAAKGSPGHKEAAAAAAAGPPADTAAAAASPAGPLAAGFRLQQQQQQRQLQVKATPPRIRRRQSFQGESAGIAAVAPTLPLPPPPPAPFLQRHAVQLLLCLLCLFMLAVQLAMLRHLRGAQRESLDLQRHLEGLVGAVEQLARAGAA